MKRRKRKMRQVQHRAAWYLERCVLSWHQKIIGDKPEGWNKQQVEVTVKFTRSGLFEVPPFTWDTSGTIYIDGLALEQKLNARRS